MAQYSDILEELGLAKNEARIYETLVREGESGVGEVSVKSGVHRRNVYDSLNRLTERGLVFERITSTEHLHQATDPRKLTEILKEKEEKVEKILPELEKLYAAVPHTDDVVVYRGIEGWKNYLRDIVRVGEDVYTIGAKGAWQDPRLASVLAQTARESKKKGIKMHLLCDPKAKGDLQKNFSEQGFDVVCRTLPKGYESMSAVDIFGDHTVIVSNPKEGSISEEQSVVVLINQQTSDAFRTWFQLLWAASGAKGKR